MCLQVLVDSHDRSLEDVVGRTLRILVAEGSSDKSTQQGAGDGVMGNLPTARPSRLSRRARGEDEATAARKPAAARAKPKTASSKAKATAAAKPKPAPAPKAAVRPKAAAKPKPAHGAEAPGRPRPVRTVSPTLEGPARKADAGRGRRADEIPPREQNPVELATTVVKAAGELAQIGATVAGQVLKRAAGKLPKP